MITAVGTPVRSKGQIQEHPDMALSQEESSFLDRKSRPLATGREPLIARLHATRDPAMPLGAYDFFGLRFTVDPREADQASDDPAFVTVPIRALSGVSPWEIWSGSGTVKRSVEAGLGIVSTADYIVAHARAEIAAETDVAAATESLYMRLLGRLRELDDPHLVRIWNYIPNINLGRGDAETYVRFNHGRAAALDRLGVASSQYPAATAVGSPAGTPLTVVVFASRTAPIAIENPRQTSAYHYPRRYGPRSPAFARAMLLPERGGGRLFISGTASIVGHESQHGGIGPQLDETLSNVAELTRAALARTPGSIVGAGGTWRVYLRNPADLHLVQPEVHRRLAGADSVVFLQADICRQELLIEVEGFCELTRSSGRSLD